tara:strand:- start:374 stop:610 length:237 start_codon:yes stop_codon:yes gene_type:complete
MSSVNNFLYQIKQRRRQEKFQEWLNRDLEMETETITNKTIVLDIMHDINLVLESNKMRINDKKRFKNILASYLYKESE